MCVQINPIVLKFDRRFGSSADKSPAKFKIYKIILTN